VSVGHKSLLRGAIGNRRGALPARFQRRLGPSPALAQARLFPKVAGDLGRIDAGGFPPSTLIADMMDCAVMRPAQRYDEFIADPAARRARLHEADVVGVRGGPATDEACLLGVWSRSCRPIIAKSSRSLSIRNHRSAIHSNTFSPASTHQRQVKAESLHCGGGYAAPWRSS
jgi:hypothetical protein